LSFELLDEKYRAKSIKKKRAKREFQFGSSLLSLFSFKLLDKKYRAKTCLPAGRE